MIAEYFIISKSTSYNLQSSKADPIQVPIKLQLNDGNAFLSKLLQVNSQPNNKVEQELYVSSSDSELNCSDVVADSHKDQTGEQECDKSGDLV